MNSKYSQLNKDGSPERFDESHLSELDESIDDEKEHKDHIVKKSDQHIDKSPKRTNNSNVISERQQKSSNYILIFIFFLTALAVCVSSLGLYVFNVSFQPTNNPRLSNIAPTIPTGNEKLIIDEIKKIQKNFPNQSVEVWTNIFAALNSITMEDPPQPAVLLLISPDTDQAKETATCLSLRIATTANRLFNTSAEMMIRADQVVQFPRKEDIRAELDKKMKAILEHSTAVIVSQLQEIPAYAALILHGYCDNFEALFKKRVIIITAAFGSETMKTQREVDRHLRQLWDAEIGIDKSASLVSRVANNLIFVQPEVATISCL